MTGLERFFESYYRLRPVNATFTGVHEHDDRLPDWSPDGLEALADEMRSLHASLAKTRRSEDLGQEGSPGDSGRSKDPRHDSSSEDLHHTGARDRALATAFLEIQIAELETLHFQRGNPSLAIGEAAFGLISLVTRPFAPAAARARTLAGRLEAWPAFLAGARHSIARGIPDEWRVKCLRECQGADHLLADGIARWLASESLDEPRVLSGCEAARAALDEFRRWLTTDVPAAPPGRCSVGSGLFGLLLRRGHWCAQDAASLGTDARDALDDALAELDRRARAAASGGWPEVQARLAGVHPAAKDYVGTYQRIWDDCRAASERADLVTWPAYPLRYVPIPEHTRGAAPYLYYLFYRSPAPFDRLPIHDYVVTPVDDAMPRDEQERRLRATNTSVIKLNHVVHHGAIGHHVQNFYAYGGESDIGRVAAVDCASRIGMFCGGTMAEGWACYATDLMDEVGFLTPDESIAQQHTRARMLARAVVDIELHCGSMAFDEAVALYRDQVGMTDEAARAEACKNSMFPGTAIMYWIGTEGLHHIRRMRQLSEGVAFTLRAFHDRVLSFGSIPVPLLGRIW